MRSKRQPDYVLIVLVFFLIAFGLVMIYTISPVASRNYFGDDLHRNHFFTSQLVYFLIGLAAFVVASRIKYDFWKRWALPLAAGAGILSLMVFLPGLGVSEYGARRWVNLGLTQVQPAEVLKIALIIYLAFWLSRLGTKVKDWNLSFKPFAFLLVCVSLLLAVFQKDLGTMLIVDGVLLAMYFVAGAEIKHIGLLLAGGAVVLTLLIVLFPHRLERLTTFAHPDQDPQGAGYHISQVLIAVGSGGLFGRGIGKSIQLYGYVPAPPTDSIFAIIAEEFGLLGALIIITAFIAIAARGYQIARGAPDDFARLLAIGIVSTIVLQATLNIAAMLALVPLTGVPLPFISYGGSSMVFTLGAFGILINISRYQTEVASAHRDLGRGHGGAYLSSLGRSR